MSGNGYINFEEVVMKSRIIALAIIVLSIPVITFGADFDFYGVRLGNTKDEVGKVFSISSEYGVNVAKDPGHRISKLFFTFDNNNRLYNIEVYYALGNSNEENEALLQAINEVFTDPLKKRNDIDVKTDTYTDISRYGNTKYIILNISSKKQSNDYVKYLKSRIIEKMK
jgi:hypothetical protein